MYLVGLLLCYPATLMQTRTYNKHEMRAYIPRWRGEAEVVIAAGNA